MHYFDDIFENIFLAGAPFVNLFDILLKKKDNNPNISRKWRNQYIDLFPSFQKLFYL